MRSTRLVAAANSARQRLMSSLVMACGIAQPVSYGIADGASGVHASGPSRIGFSAPAGGGVGGVRPACASCAPSLATPYWRQKSCTRLSAASLSSEYMPAHFGEMRPWRLTLVISHITSPAAPSDILPRCIRCQSLAEPSLELYWHIGDTTTRFGSVRPRSVIGENRTLAIFRFSFRGAENSDGFCSAPDAARVIGMHGDDGATNRPEQAKFGAADVPQPFAGDFIDTNRGDQKLDGHDRGANGGVDVENQTGGEHDLDGAGQIHPEFRRLEPGGDEEAKRRRDVEFAVNVRNHEQPADQSQDVEFVEQIEVGGD